MKFVDMNGKELKIGDHILPDGKGRELLIISQAYVADYEAECMFGQQIIDPLAFSVLTYEDLSTGWILKED